MSGGHFDYNQYRIEDVAREIEEIIEKNPYDYSPEILEKLKEASWTIHQAAEMAQRIDWFFSGDDGEESFVERWQNEVRRYWNEDLKR